MKGGVYRMLTTQVSAGCNHSVDSLKKHSGKILKCYTFVSLKKSFRICRLSGFEAMPLNGSR